MISCLHIQNIATIENLFVEFHQGLNALTGETGAGKSVLLESISMLLGQKVQPRMIREGAEKGDVQGVFDFSSHKAALEWLEVHGLTTEDPTQVVLRREFSLKGRSRSWINGRIVPITDLKEFGEFAAKFYHQHQQVFLAERKFQRELFDTFCGTTELYESVRSISSAIRSLKNQKKELEASQHERLTRLDYLEFQLKEFDSIEIESFSEEELHEERNALKNTEERRERTLECLTKLEEGEGLSDGLIAQTQQMVRSLELLSRVDSKTEEYAAQAESALTILQDLAMDLNRYQSNIEDDPSRLEELDDLLAQFRKLERKFGAGHESVFSAHQKIKEELRSIQDHDGSLSQIDQQIRQQIELYQTESKQLSSERRKGAKKLHTAIQASLKELAMPMAKFDVKLKPHAEEKEFSPEGNEQVSFLFSANGENTLKELGEVASGGELSRLSLALCLQDQRVNRPRLLIFDEIDTGIGGEALISLGNVLLDLGKANQILAITHQASIASRASCHFQLSKSKAKGSKRLSTRITELHQDERVEEVARMLDGKGTRKSKDLAHSLINDGQ